MTDQTSGMTRRQVMAAGASLALLPADARSAPSEPRRGGTMTVVLAGEPPSLVSLISTASLTCSAKVTEGLLWYDHDMKPQPQLATDWSVSPDGLTYQFTLRRGVKWHDGQDFTADDVAFSIETLRRVHPRARSTFAHITTIETPDPYRVTLRLGVPVPYLIKAFAAAESPIVAKHIYSGTDPFTNPNNRAPIGTGPFRFKQWQRGSFALYERNPDYWDQPRPYLDQLIVKFITDPGSRSVALETGAADLGYRTPVALNDVERLGKLPNLQFERLGYEYNQNVINISFNLDNLYLKELKVRQAIAHAINREIISRTIYYGWVDPCVTPIGPALKEYHDPSPTPYPFDAHAAELLLDDAGLKRGADRIRFKLTFDASPLVDEPTRLGDYIRVALGRVGIAVELRTEDAPTYLKRVYTDRNFDFTCGSLSNLFDPTVGVQRLYWSKDFIKGVPFSNAAHYVNARVDELLEGAAIEPDAAKRKAMFTEFQKIETREIPDLNIGVPRWITIHNVRAQGHSVTADGLEGNLAYAYIAS